MTQSYDILWRWVITKNLRCPWSRFCCTLCCVFSINKLLQDFKDFHYLVLTSTWHFSTDSSCQVSHCGVWPQLPPSTLTESSVPTLWRQSTMVSLGCWCWICVFVPSWFFPLDQHRRKKGWIYKIDCNMTRLFVTGFPICKACESPGLRQMHRLCHRLPGKVTKGPSMEVCLWCPHRPHLRQRSANHLRGVRRGRYRIA